MCSLSTQVYGSSARFIFELLQNADDNRFMKARAAATDPRILICRHPDRIVVECNEDGFTLRDLQAICTVGQSTKSNSYGYIGAKGIGFKSVFMVASKVYIQSGDFSFYFEQAHRDGNLGMVTPIWQEPEEVLPGPLTRMTLHLHKDGDPTAISHIHRTIDEQLRDIQCTCLLFLRNLRQIKITFHDCRGALTRSKEFRVGETLDHHVSLDTIQHSAGGLEETESRQYHIIRHIADSLPESESRTSLDTSQFDPARIDVGDSSAANGGTAARSSEATSEVILAFPTTDDSEPTDQRQEIFSFLPVRESAYKVGNQEQ